MTCGRDQTARPLSDEKARVGTVGQARGTNMAFDMGHHCLDFLPLPPPLSPEPSQRWTATSGKKTIAGADASKPSGRGQKVRE
ncbi:hypothetical protein BaRGS_00035845 [Batillaria attramentaria]|uniref:Uncharacterized protein n=1 Tax=Batillaria attramentaria TaxID=370345 RepID=A0ABD0JDG3_9CAEN